MSEIAWRLSPYVLEQLACRMTLVVKPLPACPVTTVSIWVRAGAADETEDNNGIAHFLEHMFFKGTPNLPVGALDREVKALGGYNNAGTSFDYTEYFICLPSHHWRRAVELLAEFLLHPALRPEDIDSERRVVLEEIGRKEDSPFSKLYQDFVCAAFRGSPYGRPILGEQPTLSRIDRDAFLRFLGHHYTPDRMALVVAGDVRPEEVRALAEPLFAELGERGASKPTPFTPPDWQGPQTIRLNKPLQQGYGLLGFTLPDIKATPTAYALEVAANVLAGGRASRLYRELHDERGLVSDVDSSLWDLRHAALFYVEATYDPQSHEEVMRIVRQHIETLASDRVPTDELERAKRLLLSDFIFGNEMSAAISGTIGHFLVSVGLDEADRFCGRVADVTAEDVRSAVASYLLDPCCTTAILADGNRTT